MGRRSQRRRSSLTSETPAARTSTLRAALLSRCPRCGQGALYSGFLTLKPRCDSCGLDYSGFDPGDGPVPFIILIVGFIVLGLALFVELRFEPPYWVHAVLWVPLIVILSLALMRPLKSGLIALQFKHNAGEGRLAD